MKEKKKGKDRWKMKGREGERREKRMEGMVNDGKGMKRDMMQKGKEKK